VLGGQADRVDAQAAGEGGRVLAGGLECAHQCARRGQLVRAAGDVHGGQVQQHVGEHLAQVLGGDRVGVGPDPHGGTPAFEVGQHGGAGGGGVGVLVQLGDVPAVGHLTAANGGTAGE